MNIFVFTPAFENRRNELAAMLYNHAEDGKSPTPQRNGGIGLRFSLLLLGFAPPQRELQVLGIKKTYYMIWHYLRLLVKPGELKMTIPDCLSSYKQKYYRGMGLL